MARQEHSAVATAPEDASEEQGYGAVAAVGAPVEDLARNPIARQLVLAEVHPEATGLGVSVRMGLIAGDAAQAEDTTRRSPWVIEQLAGKLRLEEH